MKINKFNFPEYKREVQLPLFNIKDREEEIDYPFPEIIKGHEGIERVINETDMYLGIDLEFNTKSKRCSILGVSNRHLSASASFDPEQAKKIIRLAKAGKFKLVGFSINGAEKAILEHNLKCEIPLDIFEDTMLLFYLCNSHLTKSDSGKEGHEKGTLGFINLYCCSTIYTNLPNWKLCRKQSCIGPCPSHDVFSYNAVDAFAGLIAFYRLLEESERYGLTYQFYRDLLELSYVAQMMQDQGVNVDRKLAKELDNLTIEEKNKLFEPEDFNAVVPFNPNSSQEILKYFKENKLKLNDTSKPEIEKVLKKLAAIAKMDYDEFIISEVPEHVSWLIKLAQYKGLGKGFKGWFKDEYFQKDGYSDGLLHPRSSTTGTQTGRFSHSKPNYANMPGFKED